MTKRVAIAGFAFRLPQTNHEQYWQDLLDGRKLITEVPADRWSHDAFLHPHGKHPGTSVSLACGTLGDVSRFDAEFFGISPREAAQMDPQQRLLLEMSWEALENAGMPPSALRGSDTGVFIGLANTDYAYRLAHDLAAIDASTPTGNAPSIAANRLSFFLDLHGPSMAIDTACSSSLVAFHQACRSITSGETTMALAGGITLHLHPFGYIGFSKASMLSRTGRCHPFDASGDGYVRSEGGGVFVLKDYDQAVADGDNILAVVAASAVNTDGRKSGLTVPNPEAQAALLRRAYRTAGIDPDDIDYLEAHGTGTAVGDPIEARAIGEALGRRRRRDNPLWIGSVKSNLGHLETASGVAGLVKALHCLRHRTVPATVGVRRLNPHIPFDELNLDVVRENRTLKPRGRLTVGVNSFGFGGANAHVVLQSADRPAQPAPARDAPVPVLVSGKTPGALGAAASELAAWIGRGETKRLYDVAYNSLFRRDWHQHRLMVLADSTESLKARLDEWQSSEQETGSSPIASGQALEQARGPVFVYSGNGSQWAGMGARLLQDAAFRRAVRGIDAHFVPLAGFSLEQELAGGNEGADRYARTEIAQPALFAFQVGVTCMLREQGIEPLAVAGHSVGEVAAAWACGALTLPAAVEVIYRRSQAQGKTKGQGQMAAVGVGRAEMERMLDELELGQRLCIAGVNSPRGVTIAGDTTALTELEMALAHRSVFQRRLDLDYAFHSAAMDAIEPEIRASLAHLKPQAAAIPFYSTVAGKRTEGTQLDADYWWHNVREPVLFEAAIAVLQYELDANLFVEIGPHAVLRTYLNDCLKARGGEGLVLTTALRNEDAPARVQQAAAHCMLAGAPVDWQRLFPDAARFVRLPNYPWQREPHWHAATAESQESLQRQRVHPLLGHALPQHALTWENQLDTLKYPSLADHVVGTAVVFPAAGFAELALAAAGAWHGNAIIEIEDLEIHAPLLLNSEHSKRLRFTLDERDGRFHADARQYAKDEPWTRHATGRIRPQAAGLSLRSRSLHIPQREADFGGERHGAATHAVGLAYGPSFQCIIRGWIEGEHVWAALRLPEATPTDLADTLLHPALLDCAFQLVVELLGTEGSVAAGVAFLPTRLGRLSYRRDAGEPAFARATLVKRNPHSLTLEFALFAQDGQAVAVVEDACFRSVRLQKSGARQLRFLDEHLVPCPHPLAAVEPMVLEPEALRASLAHALGARAQSSELSRYAEEVEPLLDVLCNRFLREALEAIVPSEGLTPDWAAHHAFRTYLLQMAHEDGVITDEDGVWRLVPEADTPIAAREVWKALLADYPHYAALIHGIGRVGLHLPALLRGEAQAEGICPPLASLPGWLEDTLSPEAAVGIGHGLRSLITNVRAALPASRRLGVLHVGSAVSRFMRDICAALDFDTGDYVFASRCVDALEAFADIRERYPLAQARALEDGAFAAMERFQLAIVHHDHADEGQLVAELAFAARHLAPGGALLVLGMHPARWLDFLLAGQPGWLVKHKGSHWRSPLRPAQYWQTQMSVVGCSQSHLIELAPGAFSGPYLLLAHIRSEVLPVEAPQEQLPRLWLLLRDKSGLSAELSARIESALLAQGDRVVRASFSSSAGIADVNGATPVDGVLFLTGLRALPAHASDEVVLAHQVNRCAAAAEFMRWSEEKRVPSWIVTSGALADADTPAASADRALWGFARSMQNEAGTTDIRLVDLAARIDTNIAAAALIRELKQADAETEIVIAADGSRHATRLRELAAPHASVTCDPGAHETVRLGFEFPGQLRDLRWEAHALHALAEDELDVEVRATGLNFRDVMYAQGLLPDEALDKGFAGAGLGLEFSGVVRAAGVKVRNVKPGDRVLGFGPASFASRVITKADAVAALPGNISFEAAATIPTAFFTVYYALKHLARLEPGEKILIHGAAGGVGIAAIQLAQHMGAEIHATAGSEAKRDFLRLMGVQHVYDSRSLVFADQLLTNTGGAGVDVVLNSLAGEAIRRNLQVLKPFGRFLELGKRDFFENTHIGLRPFRNNISFFGIDADQLMLANPRLTRTLFGEVMALFAQGALHPLPYRVFDAAQVVDAFRYMQQSRQIGKVVVTYRNGFTHVTRPKQAEAAKGVLAADATYLVTGGLSGFGLRSAEWLAERGARHLVLLSRSGAQTDEAKDVIARLARQGVDVLAAACDVTDAVALERLLAQVRTTRPPLRGVIHAAAVIEDALVRNLDAVKIRGVLAPKVLGALHLHRATRAMPLDFFVLFSSATTLFGNPGQGSYVAANSYLEALAGARRRAGLAATCVRWGAIDDVGFLARNEEIKKILQHRMGGAALDSTVALDALADLLAAGRCDTAVLEFEWSETSRLLPAARAPRFAELSARTRRTEHAQEDSTDIQQLLQQLSGAELHRAVVDLLKQEVSEVLRLSPEKIDANRSLYDIGLDSLMGVELMTALEARFGVHLPVMALAESPTLARLAERVIDLLKGDEPQQQDDSASQVAQIVQIAAQHGVDASSETIAQVARDVKRTKPNRQQVQA